MKACLTFVEVTVSTSDGGDFFGRFEMPGGTKVISAANRYGKSLAVTAIGWTLGLEVMFGRPPKDPSRFSHAVRQTIEHGEQRYNVIASRSAIGLQREDGVSIRLERSIEGGDLGRITVTEFDAKGLEVRKSDLAVGDGSMKDEVAGFQNFLFKWFDLPHVPVHTRQSMTPTEVYWENLAPLFLIDQNEGWTHLHAQQVYRYQQTDIESIAVEYLLGATATVRARLAANQEETRQALLHEQKELLASEIEKYFHDKGWSVGWSSFGGLARVVERWSTTGIVATLKDKTGVDLAERQSALGVQAERLRNIITSDPIDSGRSDASSGASQEVLNLKSRRHEIRDEIRTLRLQKREEEEILGSIAGRLRAANDVYRLKSENIGRFEGEVECPTCHRHIAPEDFSLTVQSADAVDAHIRALRNDLRFIQSNVEAIDGRLIEANVESDRIDRQLRGAERSLATMNQIAGSAREQMSHATTQLIEVEKETDDNARTIMELNGLQNKVNVWVAAASLPGVDIGAGGDLENRRNAFIDALQRFLEDVGHEGIKGLPGDKLSLREKYLPYWGERRVSAIGSASDQSRLVMAYALGLADASRLPGGLHPGMLLFDEPLQQNPDTKHRKLFIDFLVKKASTLPFQMTIFTHLNAEEVKALSDAGIPIEVRDSGRFLQPVPKSSEPTTKNEDGKPAQPSDSKDEVVEKTSGASAEKDVAVSAAAEKSSAIGHTSDTRSDSSSAGEENHE